MNNRGQSLIMFVLILPLIALFIAFFIDSSLSLMEKSKLDGIITSNMEEALKNDIRDEDKIRNAIKKNDKMDIIVSVVEDELRVIVKLNKKSIFAKILNFEYYSLNFNDCASYTTKEINKKCG
jgi:hypothetical protein